MYIYSTVGHSPPNKSYIQETGGHTQYVAYLWPYVGGGGGSGGGGGNGRHLHPLYHPSIGVSKQQNSHLTQTDPSNHGLIPISWTYTPSPPRPPAPLRPPQKTPHGFSPRLLDRNIRGLRDALRVVQDALLAVGAAAPAGGVHAGDGGDAHDRLLLLDDAEAVLEAGVVLAAELVARAVDGVVGDAVARAREGARSLEEVLEERAEGGQAGGDDADGELDAVPDVVGVVAVDGGLVVGNGTGGGEGTYRVWSGVERMLIWMESLMMEAMQALRRLLAVDEGKAGQASVQCSQAQNPNEGDPGSDVELEAPNDRNRQYDE